MIQNWSRFPIWSLVIPLLRLGLVISLSSAFFKVSYMSPQNTQMLPPKAWNTTRTRWFLLNAKSIICLKISFLTEIPLSKAFGNAVLCCPLQPPPAAAPPGRVIPDTHPQYHFTRVWTETHQLWVISEHCQVTGPVFPRWWKLTPRNCPGQCGSLVNSHCRKVQATAEQNEWNGKSLCSPEPGSLFLKTQSSLCKHRMNWLSVFLPVFFLPP